MCFEMLKLRHRQKRALHVLNFIWFGYIVGLSQWGEERGNFLLQMISTCLPYAWGGGRGVSQQPGGYKGVRRLEGQQFIKLG
jgi:hypothetical protein